MTRYQQMKQQVVDAARALADKGIFKATEGNVSFRVPGESSFAVTASSIDYYKMTADDICILDIATVKLINGKARPSIESGMHAAVYQERPDVHVVLHTHQVYASTLALIDTAIPALFDEQVRHLGRGVEIIPYAPSGTSFLSKKVRNKIANGNNAYILQNHGVIVLGGNLERAMHNIELLEKCALTYLLALCTNKPITKVPLIVREVAFSKLRKDERRFALEGAQHVSDSVLRDFELA